MIDTLDGWESVSSLALALSEEARVLASEGNLAEAEKQLRRAIAFDTYCLKAYEWLEYVLDAQGRFDESCDVRALKRRSMSEIALW
jgi:tetratricopeptide (TPR) repeat protein